MKSDFVIRPRPPFNFARTLRFILSPPELMNGRSFAPLLDYYEEGEYRRVAAINGQPVLFGVSEAGRGRVPGLAVRCLAGLREAPAQAGEVEREVRELVERQFSTRLDLAPFYRLAQADPVLSKLAAHFDGMRIPQAPTVYESLIGAILEQQVNLTFAHQVKKALIETYGTGVEHQGRHYNAFPEPAALAITTVQELRRLQISSPKARYIIGISRAALDGTVDLEGLRELDPAVAQAKLLEFKGVGLWTAHYVGLRALGHLDCLPVADVGLQKSIQRFYGFRSRPSPRHIERLAQNWAGWRSYATFYLWLTYWEDAAWKDRLVETIRAGQRGQDQIKRQRAKGKRQK
jgi:DNA-3-methyladenine glycosylase II